MSLANLYSSTFFYLLHFPTALTLSTSDNLGIKASVRFEDCVFSQNTAVEVGGALGVAFHRPSVNHQGIDPLEIMNWYVMLLLLLL